jgi:hypothetical protein
VKKARLSCKNGPSARALQLGIGATPSFWSTSSDNFGGVGNNILANLEPVADETDFQNLGLCLQYTVVLRIRLFHFLADQPPGGDAGVPPRNVTPRQNKLQPGQTQDFVAKTLRDVQPCLKSWCEASKVVNNKSY